MIHLFVNMGVGFGGYSGMIRCDTWRLSESTVSILAMKGGGPACWNILQISDKRIVCKAIILIREFVSLCVVPADC